jgi:long-chain acyl-CoA synthetase
LSQDQQPTLTSLSLPQWINYNEALLRAKNFGSGLIGLGLEPGASTFICIYSQNRPEWVLCEQACYNHSLVLVPLYDTLGPDACAFIVNQTESTVVVVEDDKKVNLLLDKAPRNLKKLIVIKALRPATAQRAKNRGIDIHTFDEVEKLGAAKNYPEVPPRPSDVCTICYTSGTTGSPKGVMLTHQNVLACIVSVCMQLGESNMLASLMRPVGTKCDFLSL